MGNKHSANVQRMMAMQQVQQQQQQQRFYGAGAYGAMSNPMYQGTNMQSRMPWANQPFGYNQQMGMPMTNGASYPSYGNGYSGTMYHGMYGPGYPYQQGAAGIAGGQTYVEQVNTDAAPTAAKAAF